MTDQFSNDDVQLDSPAEFHYTVTPDDDADLDPVPRTIRVLTDGDMAVRDKAGTDITYPVTAGEYFPFRGRRILSTGTTATMVAWY